MGVDKPNYTQIPNLLLDDLLPYMNEAEMRVTLALTRLTFGYHRDKVEISLSKLQEVTRLSRQGVINGINAGIERGTIGRTDGKRGGFVYELIINGEHPSTSQPSRPVNQVDHPSTSQPNGLPLVNQVDQTSQPSRPVLVNQVDQNTPTLKKGIKERTKNKKKEREDADASPPDTEWPKFLQSLCWICHGHEDISALTEKQRGALTAEGKKIRDDGYAISDLSQWMKQHWFKDWRWKKDRQRPEPHTVRSSIPILRDTEPSTSGYRVDMPDVEFMPDVHPLQPAQNGHSPPPLPHDDPWAVCLAELNITLASGFLPMLTGSRIEEAGLVNRDDGSRVALYRLILLPERASSGLDHFAKQALPEIRKKLSSLLGHRVLLEIAAHQERAP